MSGTLKSHDALVLSSNSEIIAANVATNYFLGKEHPIAERLLSLVYALHESTPAIPIFWGKEKTVVVEALHNYAVANTLLPGASPLDEGTRAHCAQILGLDLKALGLVTINQDTAEIRPPGVA